MLRVDDVCVSFVCGCGALYTYPSSRPSCPSSQVVEAHPDVFLPGQKVLFLHTGGGFGLYDKAGELTPKMAAMDPGQTAALSLEGLINTESTASKPGMR